MEKGEDAIVVFFSNFLRSDSNPKICDGLAYVN